jgi:predicted pyridoxine 5'-phosphate oxidase superfamily flavin-nucleotide-binding protein
MALLTEKVQNFVRIQRLGYVATVCPDGTPNLSPKGTLTVWDGDHLVFADLNSPGTVRNLQNNPSIEINVVDEFIRKGYRFKGKAQVLTEGTLYEQILDFYTRKGLFDAPRRVRAIVLIEVAQVRPLISPGYDREVTEGQVRAQWERYYDNVRSKASG